MRCVNAATFLVALFIFGCVSEERTESKWNDFVSENNACSVADDCALVYPGCPLGCYAAVSADRVSAAEQKAEQLIRSYQIDVTPRCWQWPGLRVRLAQGDVEITEADCASMPEDSRGFAALWSSPDQNCGSDGSAGEDHGSTVPIT